MKIGPLLRAIESSNSLDPAALMAAVLVHTGQHYDYQMSQVFFEDMGIPPPDHYLGVGSGSHAEQTAATMTGLDPVLSVERPDILVVVGDVNSTLGAALTAVKRHVPVAHVEAGLRSYDRSMPEEINRVLTDAVSDYLFTPDAKADENLLREGIPRERVFRVGNIMVDSLLHVRQRVERSSVLQSLHLRAGEYAVLTLHHADSVDSEANLRSVAAAVGELSSRTRVVFPCHPRTRKNIARFGLERLFGLTAEPARDGTPGEGGLITTAPLGYVDFISLLMRARLVLTDSGGIQTEAVVLGVPCLVTREATAWQALVDQGTNVVTGYDPQRIVAEATAILEGRQPPRAYPELWDGHTAERVMDVLRNRLGLGRQA